MEMISGGVCAPKGFKASGVHCGIRKNKSKKDLALIFSEVKGPCACVYTTNLVKGAPIAVTRENVADGYAQAVICNSGNANTCNLGGEDVAREMCALAGAELGISPSDVIVASTGVIGQPLDITPIAGSIGELVKGLKGDCRDACEAIMTTDTVPKEAAAEFTAGGKTCRIGGIAKGSGMIHPNMATMLVFVTTDAAITSEMLQKALSEDVRDSFNMVSVDGDTSTNDMVSVISNGLAGNTAIDSEGADFDEFKKALAAVTKTLCRKIAGDGEGATKLIECVVTHADTKENAVISSKAVISSSLVKAAMFGADANWGRVLCAIGYSGADVDVNRVDVSFASEKGNFEVCKDGRGVEFSEEKAKTVLGEKEIKILVDLNSGTETATAWGCDLTYEYVKINGDYRT